MPAPVEPTEPSAHSVGQHEPPSNPSALPPEALALAARLFDAARQGDDALLSQALAGGLKPNMMNDKGDSLLMLASYHGHSSTVSLLLSHGADANTLNARGQSPLAGTVFKHELEIAKKLVETGADPDAGQPSAREAVGIFGVGEEWRDILPA